MLRSSSRQRRDGLHVVSDDDDDDSRVVVNLDDIARRYSIVSEGSLRQKNAGSKNQQDKAWVKVKREAPQSAAARKRPFPTSSVTSSEVAKRLKTTPPGAAGTISK